MTCLNSWAHLIRGAAIGCAIATCASVADAQPGKYIRPAGGVAHHCTQLSVRPPTLDREVGCVQFKPVRMSFEHPDCAGGRAVQSQCASDRAP